MSSDVSLQQPGTGEGFAAQLAFARERVRANVHLKRAQRHVRLLAILARESLFDLRQAVKLFVLGQAADRRIAFVAIFALESRRLVDVVVVGVGVVVIVYCDV